MSGATRREALAGFALTMSLGAVPGRALATAASGRPAWNAATARVRCLTDAVSRIGEHCTAAHEEAEKACPRKDELFSRYNLHSGVSRKRNFQSAQMAVLMERCRGRASLSDEEARQATTEANRLVDEFEAYRAAREQAFSEYDDIQDRFDKALDECDAARSALLNMPAPDQAALLEKIDLLAQILDEACAEDKDRMAAVRADAHRLLSGGRL